MRDDRVKYQESSIGFENLAHLQSIENKCNWLLQIKCQNSSYAFFYLMLLLTNCDVHTAKYSDSSFKVRTVYCIATMKLLED